MNNSQERDSFLLAPFTKYRLVCKKYTYKVVIILVMLVVAIVAIAYYSSSTFIFYSNATQYLIDPAPFYEALKFYYSALPRTNNSSCVPLEGQSEISTG